MSSINFFSNRFTVLVTLDGLFSEDFQDGSQIDVGTVGVSEVNVGNTGLAIRCSGVFLKIVYDN